MPQNPKLHTYEELTLLVLKDKEGTVSVAHVAQLLAGSLVAELIFLNRITVEENAKKLVSLVDPKPTGDPLLDECIEKLAIAKRRARLATWISRFASIKRLHHRAAEQLCQRGILSKTTSKVLFLFNRTVYPEENPKPEQDLIERIERVITSETPEVSAKDAILISLADASSILDKTFGSKWLKPYRKRIKQISSGSLAGNATREILQAIQAAIIATTVIAATAVTTS